MVAASDYRPQRVAAPVIPAAAPAATSWGRPTNRPGSRGMPRGCWWPCRCSSWWSWFSCSSPPC